MKIHSRILSFLKYLSVITGSLIATVPILVVFIASFKSDSEFLDTNALKLPENFLNFKNYITAFIDGRMMIGFINTTLILVISLTGAILIGTMVAYVISRFDFKFKKVILAAFLLATLIPGVTTQVATFQIVESLGLFNTRLAAIILYLGTDIIAIYIFIQFMEGISISLDEAAMLEGASYIRIYGTIILPLVKPAIVTVMIIKGISIYNDFYIPFLYMPKKSLQVVSTSLFKFIGPYGSNWEIISAAIIIAIIPTLIIFLFLQKYIYNGFTAGSVK
ncbi:MAG: carbohydrate ABC transporter permease [Spirochaetales bacterium]|nr:carbohydrate ABC transporter permease [Spirochaetales bacterium]